MFKYFKNPYFLTLHSLPHYPPNLALYQNADDFFLPYAYFYVRITNFLYFYEDIFYWNMALKV